MKFQDDPTNAIDYYNRGVLKYTELNDIEGALADYNQAIILNPQFANAYYNRGNLKYYKLNDIEGAFADYDYLRYATRTSDYPRTSICRFAATGFIWGFIWGFRLIDRPVLVRVVSAPKKGSPANICQSIGRASYNIEIPKTIEHLLL